MSAGGVRELLEGALRRLTGDEKQDRSTPSAPVKFSAKDAAYTPEGPFPFVCGNCCHLTYRGKGTYGCKVVEGPESGGQVGVEDTCMLFRPRLASMSKEDD